MLAKGDCDQDIVFVVGIYMEEFNIVNESQTSECRLC